MMPGFANTVDICKSLDGTFASSVYFRGNPCTSEGAPTLAPLTELRILRQLSPEVVSVGKGGRFPRGRPCTFAKNINEGGADV